MTQSALGTIQNHSPNLLSFCTTTWFILLNWSLCFKEINKMKWNFLRLRPVLAADVPIVSVYIHHLCSIEHPLWLEHHTHEWSCYTARDYSYCGDTCPRPQKSKQPGWNGLRNSVTVPKGKQVKANVLLHFLKSNYTTTTTTMKITFTSVNIFK